MKKASQYALVIFTCAFMILIAGIFLGRNTDFTLLEYPAESSDFVLVPDELVIYSKDLYINGKLNINVAAKEDLTLLPGIGDTLSDRIIAYREENGYFKEVDELLLVDGMGDGKLSKIKEYLTVGGSK